MKIHNRQSNKQVFFFYKYVNIFIQIEAKPVKNVSSFLLFSGHSELKTGPLSGLACENIHFSSLFVDGDVSREGTSATQRQKFHTDDVNQCLHNKSGSHRIPNANLFNFTFLLVDFGKVLCSSANELQQNSNASSREDYIPQILTVLLEILRVYI